MIEFQSHDLTTNDKKNNKLSIKMRSNFCTALLMARYTLTVDFEIAAVTYLTTMSVLDEEYFLKLHIGSLSNKHLLKP